MKIAVYGLGISARSVLKYLENNEIENDVYVVNRGNDWQANIHKSFTCIEEKDAKNLFASVDQIVISPGIDVKKDVLKDAIKNNVEIISEIEFAYRRCSYPIIAVTGSNGKTTTVTMIHELLNSYGKKSFLCGNIGIPFSQVLLKKEKYDYIVLEMSSFQLETIKKFNPLISIITNITPNHMERYDSFEDYENAKHRIYMNQKDGVIVCDKKISIKDNLKKIEIEKHDYDYTKSLVKGEHNSLNFSCAFDVLKELGFYDRDINQSFVNSFTGVNFRLKYTGVFNKNSFYNDAKSTNLNSTLTAINAFENQNDIVLILGGKKRSDDISEFDVLKKYTLDQILCFGDAAADLSNLLGAKPFETLDQIFTYISLNITGKNIIFSPGFPSFDQYQNFEKRGEDFNRLFLALIGN
ncbi:MAG: UDP-N-acetylmuramoyl-L-alanine--D-glutamate ligase [Bacteriovoracaceae bacterium]|jgi:UDP-N-acetylmuramoylalanine--D-glutamate ligase|nr:UDP-N-acetylmuramoyl-L-alanine--D-glutamate ligase [Bacteriovoracaceae bacterium]